MPPHHISSQEKTSFGDSAIYTQGNVQHAVVILSCWNVRQESRVFNKKQQGEVNEDGAKKRNPLKKTTAHRLVMEFPQAGGEVERVVFLN